MAARLSSDLRAEQGPEHDAIAQRLDWEHDIAEASDALGRGDRHVLQSCPSCRCLAAEREWVTDPAERRLNSSSLWQEEVTGGLAEGALPPTHDPCWLSRFVSSQLLELCGLVEVDIRRRLLYHGTSYKLGRLGSISTATHGISLRPCHGLSPQFD